MAMPAACRVGFRFFKINKYDKIYSSILKFIRYKFKDNNEFNTAIVLWFNRKMTIKKFVPSYYVNAYKMEENKYGDISLWDTTNVTDMLQSLCLFSKRACKNS